jgi:hypothetical protein
MAIVCPWCGTNYTEFLSNCRNCGGPLPAPKELAPPSEKLLPHWTPPTPPAPPREISKNYIWRLMMQDGWMIGAAVFALIGAIFAPVGAGLVIGVITAFVGIPFLLMGLGFLGLGVWGVVWRYQEAQKVVKVLQEGVSTQGEIVDLVANYNVRVNGQTPWKVTYGFELDGQHYEGTVSTLIPPGLQLQPGMPATVLYLQDTPSQNTLYPHP